MANLIGRWAFLIGVILAVIFGLVGVNQTIVIVLLILGLVIGLLNVTERETHSMLLSAVALVIVTALGRDVVASIPVVVNILNAILILVVGATIIVALKEMFHITKTR